MRTRPLLAAVPPASVVVLLACGPAERPRGDSVAADSATVGAAAAGAVPPATDDSIVQERADWSAFRQSLPGRADSAAAALERYRQAYGLPLDFFVRVDSSGRPPRGLRIVEDEMSCGPPTATAFVRRMPRPGGLLETSAVVELDSAGRELRHWPLWSDVAYWEMVAGAKGDELVMRFAPQTYDGVYLRVRPDGEFRVSAEPPQPFPPQKWIEVEDSVFLRVQPRDDGPFYTHPSGVNPGPVGTWEPTGDSDLYVRTDSGPKRGTVARAVTRKDWSPRPRNLACPPGPEYEGMICRGFPDGGTERRIAYPIPCS